MTEISHKTMGFLMEKCWCGARQQCRSIGGGAGRKAAPLPWQLCSSQTPGMSAPAAQAAPTQISVCCCRHRSETSVFSVPNCLINRKPLEIYIYIYLDTVITRHNIKIREERSGDAQTGDVAKAVGVPPVTPIGSPCTRECASCDATPAGSRAHLVWTPKDIQDKSVVWPICMSIYSLISTLPVAGRWMSLSPHGPYFHLKGTEQGKQRRSDHCRVWGLNPRAQAEPGQVGVGPSAKGHFPQQHFPQAGVAAVPVLFSPVFHSPNTLNC